MLRALSNLANRNNINLCGSSPQEFCYPVTTPGDVVLYYKLPAGTGDVIYSIALYTQDFGSLIHIFYAITGQINQYFSYVIADDSNDDRFIALRQIQPMYNYDGVQNEVTCYSLGFTMDTVDGTTFGTEPVCYIAGYTQSHYTILNDVSDIPLMTFFITCPGDEVSNEYTYLTLPAGYWLEYTGPFVDLFIPEGCTLDQVTIGGYTQVIEGPLSVDFGASACQKYARITGYGTFKYDCKGRYFGVLEEEDIVVSNIPALLLTDAHLDISLMPINIAGAQTKTLASRSTPKRVNPSCFIPDDEWFSRYKISANCPVPAWFVDEVNNIASLQQVLVTGSNPIMDDNEVLIPVVQSDEYNWKERPLNIDFIPILFFESCVCYRNFVC